EFELLAPKTIEEAIDMVSQYGDKAAVLAGGTDVMIMLQRGAIKSPYIIALGDIAGLDYITYSKSEGLRLGALATAWQVVQDSKIKKNYTALWQAASTLGSPQIRNAATMAGNVLRASPSGDCSCALLALDASVVLRSKAGERVVPLDEFFIDYGKINCKANEIAVELRVPPTGEATRSAFMRMTRMNFDLSKVNAAVCLDMSGKKCVSARIAMGAVAPTTMRIKKAEDLLAGASISEKLLDEIAAVVSKQVKPIDDVRSTADYRRSVSGVLVKRVLQAACNA
ncbi:MAG: xanthine dehydrogenase family protein subunit M, partial [Planctomycetaceae bacterium]